MLNDDPKIQHIETAGIGYDAINVYQTNRPDCVLLDHNLPGQDGISVLQKLKGLDQFAAVIITTGQGDEDLAASALKMGASDYITKRQLTRDSLRRSIVRSIDKTRMQQEAARQESEQKVFLNNMIHDISAPIRQIRIFADQMLADARAGAYEEVLKRGSVVIDIAARLQNLIDTLRTYTLTDRPASFESMRPSPKPSTTCSDAGIASHASSKMAGSA